MRKFILTLVVALVCFVGTSATQTSANGTPARTVTVELNNSRSVIVTVSEDTSKPFYILVCAVNAAECNVANAANSQKVLRFDCRYDGANDIHVDHACRDYSETVGEHSYPLANINFVNWRANSPLNNGIIPPGSYNVRVFESADQGATYTQVSIVEVTIPVYDYEYDVAPVINGDAVVGQTLSLSNTKWTPTPNDITITWLRCNKATAAIEDSSQIAWGTFPFTYGYKYENNEDCAVIDQNGSLTEPPSLGLVSLRSNGTVTTQSTIGFTSYKLTDADIGKFIVVAITVGASQREYFTASTTIVERKTAPVNQVAPSSSFKKTKKFKKLQVGAQVSVTTGTWKWANTTTIQWYNCTKKQRSSTAINAKQCKAIKRATKVNYKVKKTNQKRFLIAQVTATNELGSTVVYVNNLRKVI